MTSRFQRLNSPPCVRATPTRLSIANVPVETAMIGGADHMYTGEEAQVARVIGERVHRVVRAHDADGRINCAGSARWIAVAQRERPKAELHARGRGTARVGHHAADTIRTLWFRRSS